MNKSKFFIFFIFKIIFQMDPSNSQEISDNNTDSTSISATPVSADKRKRKSISAVRPYFIEKIDDDKKVICVICKVPFSKNTATGTLRRHLNAQHPGWNPNEQMQNYSISAQLLTPDQKERFNILVAK
jgi:hypothetical protein